MIVDSHCHFDFQAFDNDRELALQRAHAAGIKKIIIPGVTADTWTRINSVCSTDPGLFPAYGLHPYFIDQHQAVHLQQLETWLQKHAAIAVGECGLDFYLKELDKDKQLDFFTAQLDIASAQQLPVIIHARKATEQVIQCLKTRNGLTGMIHSYSGSLEQAKQLIELGFYISFGGALTYDTATRLRKMATELPLNHLLIETDAPDQPDQHHKGQRNEPAFINTVIDTLAVLKQTSTDEIIQNTTANAERLFNLDLGQ